MNEDTFYVMKRVAFDDNGKARCFKLAKARYTMEQAMQLEFLAHPNLKRTPIKGPYYLIPKHGKFGKGVGKPRYLINVFQSKKTGDFWMRVAESYTYPYPEKFYNTKWRKITPNMRIDPGYLVELCGSKAIRSLNISTQ